MRQFRRLVGDEVILAPAVKANAYGHGLVEAAKIFLANGADWLCVNALYEAEVLREAGVQSPIYIFGYVELEELARAVELDCRLIVYNRETVAELGRIGKAVKVHIKVETGNNRQGVLMEELVEFGRYIGGFANVELEGLTTHFANIEDTTDHSYAFKQLERFRQADKLLREAGMKVKLKHCANSAATILFQETHFEMVRTGLANYGMWPSNETYVSFLKSDSELALKPALSWKTKVAQIKKIPAGEYIGYGCTYRTSHETKLAILPVGYYDGYDRGVSGRAYVLIKGQRAPVRGRVCMNITMVDVTDIEGVKLEDEVVLIGRDGEEAISAELFAAWADTINYEVTTRINERIPRLVV